MTRRQKKTLWRIVAAALLTLVAALLPLAGLGKALAFAVPYLVIGYDAPLISVLMGTEKESTVYCWKNRLLERIKRLPAARAKRYLDLVR